MAVYRSSSKNDSNTGTAISVTAPAGATTGDFVVCIVAANGQTTLVDNNGSTAFTEDLNDYKPNTTNGHTVSVFSRTLQAGDPGTYNFTSGASGRWAIISICWKGGHTYDVSPSSTNATNDDTASTGTISAPSITTGVAKTHHVTFCNWDTASTGTITTPVGYTQTQVANSGGEPLAAAIKSIATASATGTTQFTNTEFGAMIALSFSVVASSEPSNMKTFLHGFTSNTINNSTRYSPVSGYVGSAATSHVTCGQVIPTTGVLGNLYAVLDSAPGASKTWLVDVFKNNSTVLTTLTFTGAAQTSDSDTGYYAVDAGDTISYRFRPSGTPSGTKFRFKSVFVSDTSGESILLGGWQENSLSTSSTTDLVLSGTTPLNSSATNHSVIPTGGTLKKLYVALNVDPGTSPDAYTFTLYKNSSSTALTTAIVADNTTGNDASNTVSVAAGDKVYLLVSPTDTPSASPICNFGMVFAPTTDGESIMLFSNSDNLNATATEYNLLCGFGRTLSGTEANHQYYSTGITLKKLYIETQVAPGAGKSYTFTVRNGSGDTSLSAQVSGTGKTGNDTTNTADVNGEMFDLSIVPSGTPSTGDLYGGIVMVEYVLPASAVIKTINGLAKASVKTVDGLAFASVKTVKGISTT